MRIPVVVRLEEIISNNIVWGIVVLCHTCVDENVAKIAVPGFGAGQ